jgi:phosphatidylinositol alpha-1,6-mannosyltransferase
VTVLTDAPEPRVRRREVLDGMTLCRRPMKSLHWGVLGLRPLWQRLRLATEIRSLLRGRQGTVHCARALPEGLGALLNYLAGGAPYLCWAHGEELATARASRELTILTRWVYRLSHTAIANSRNTAAMLESFGVPSSRIRVIYPAVDAERFRPDVTNTGLRSRFARADEILILSVGRLQRRKGHDVAIRAMNILRSELPHLKYVIAGDGEELGRLKSLVAEYGLEEVVSFAGIIDADTMPLLYAACDIFLLPNREDNRDIEGFGIVFLEAAAAGKPTIGGNSGGVPEAIVHEVTGLLVDGASVEAVADAVRRLARSADARARMGEAGRRRAQAEFSWQRAAAAVANLVCPETPGAVITGK